eukprot:5941425-Amphidinium_carterae.1
MQFPWAAKSCCRREDAWQGHVCQMDLPQESQDDPVYALIGQLSIDPVIVDQPATDTRPTE